MIKFVEEPYLGGIRIKEQKLSYDYDMDCAGSEADPESCESYCHGKGCKLLETCEKYKKAKTKLLLMNRQ